MRKQIAKLMMVLGLVACPIMASAFEYGVIDAGQVFTQYNETKKTKDMLESKKAELQKELETRKTAVQKLDDEYVKLAKETQEKRDAKKDKEVAANEKKLADLRKQLATKQGDLQKFFEESQKNLYKLEEEQMGNLSKSLEEKVDKTIEGIAKANNLKIVLEKRNVYWQDKSAVKDITQDVIKALNGK